MADGGYIGRKAVRPIEALAVGAAAPMAADVPGRQKVLAASLIFCVASIFLLFDGLILNKYVISTPTAMNWCGVMQGLCWFIGFAVLIDWIVFDTFDEWGKSRRALIGATLKLIASAFFCVHPISSVIGYLSGVAPVGGPPLVGVPWSDLVGILFFHSGNCIDTVGMLPLFDTRKPFSTANLPVYGISIYCLATWVLVAVNVVAYLLTPAPWGPGAALSPAWGDFLGPGGILGFSLLLLGSIIWTAWAACHHAGSRIVMPPEPLLNVMPVVE